MKKAAMTSVIGFIAAFLVSCSHFGEQSLANLKPSDSDLCGTYKLTAKSKKLFDKQGDHPSGFPEIVITLDKVEVKDLPYWWKDTSGYHKQLIAGTGTWEVFLSSTGKCWEIALYPDEFFHPFSIGGKASPYQISLYDPEQNQFFTFEK